MPIAKPAGPMVAVNPPAVRVASAKVTDAGVDPKANDAAKASAGSPLCININGRSGS